MTQHGFATARLAGMHSSLFICLLATSSLALADAQRARDVGIPLAGKPGALNAITDVAGVEVGQVTLINGEGALERGKGPVRTGVTAILPRGQKSTAPVYAAWETSNAAGEMTGTVWLEERGYLDGPIMITNTHSVGVVRDAVVGWLVDHNWPGDWFTPMVAETYDGFLNDINGFHVKREHALEALKIARPGPVAEGHVGGGTGMICFGFKGGIGTASRVVTTPVGRYTVGVLVQCNFGAMTDLRIAGTAVGEPLKDRYSPCRALPPAIDELRNCERRPGAETPGDGSMIVVIATDAPLLPHQLKRLAKRPAHAMGRLGDIGRESSGDIFVAFSTANSQLHSEQQQTISISAYPNPLLNPIFEGAVQAVEESILNAMIAARTMTGRDGHRVFGLPHDELRDIMARQGKKAR